MKTSTWNPSRMADRPEAAPESPTAWLKTPVVLTTLRTQPTELELISGIYRCRQHMKEQTPFTLTTRDGTVLMSRSKDEFIVHPDFEVPFKLYDHILALEAKMAVQGALDAMEAQIAKNEAVRQAKAAEAQGGSQGEGSAA